MSEWSHGYNVSSGYTYVFFRELAPAWINAGMRLQGFQPPEAAKTRYLELGCGQGVGLCILAGTHPDIEFVGVDFNPLHIEHATKLAHNGGLKNIRFVEADFLKLAQNWPDTFGKFQYTVMHGIYSWVSQDLRKALVSCVEHALVPGGVLYNSYNSMPGWLSGVPVQRVLRTYEQCNGGSPQKAVREGLALLGRLQAGKAAIFGAQTSMANRIESAAKQDMSYLVQEYLHDTWCPMWFGEVCEELAAAKLQAAGTATLPDAFLANLLPESLRTVLAETESPVLRQELVDLCINQSFRRDIFQRGAHAPWPGQQQQAWHALALVALRGLPSREPEPDPQHPEQSLAPFTFATSAGNMTGNQELCFPILEALQNGTQTIRQLSQLPALQNTSLPSLLQTIALLLHGSYVGIKNETGDVKVAMRMNRAISRAVTDGAPYTFVCAAHIGSALHASATDLMLFEILSEGKYRTPDELGAELVQRLHALGRHFSRKGESITEPLEIQKEALTMAQTFLQTTLPGWKRLGVCQ